MTFILTAHQILKRHYSRTVKLSLLLAIVVHLCIFAFSQPVEFKPYRFPQPPDPPIVVDLQEVSGVILPDRPEEIADPVDKPEPAVEPKPSEPDDPIPYLGLDDPGTVARGVRPPEPEPFVAFDHRPVPIDLKVPSYPELAREAGIEGKVWVLILIDEYGKVLDARIRRSEVTPAMEREALRAARLSLFEPALQGVRPVRARIVIPFEFRLE